MAEVRNQKTEDRGMTTRDFEIIIGFCWCNIDEFHQCLKKHMVDGDVKSFYELSALFLEENYEAFQMYLESNYAIEGSEGELFIDQLRRQ
jgi:hypothetical protein